MLLHNSIHKTFIKHLQEKSLWTTQKSATVIKYFVWNAIIFLFYFYSLILVIFFRSYTMSYFYATDALTRHIFKKMDKGKCCKGLANVITAALNCPIELQDQHQHLQQQLPVELWQDLLLQTVMIQFLANLQTRHGDHNTNCFSPPY